VLWFRSWNCQPLTAEVQVRSQASPCEICGRMKWRYNRPVFPFEYHSINASCLSHTNTAVIRRTSGRRLGAFQKALDANVRNLSGFRRPFCEMRLLLTNDKKEPVVLSAVYFTHLHFTHSVYHESTFVGLSRAVHSIMLHQICSDKHITSQPRWRYISLTECSSGTIKKLSFWS
jgi:hypothetical protein